MLFDELTSLPEKVILSKLIQTVLEDYRLNRETFVWLIRNDESKIINFEAAQISRLNQERAAIY